MAINHGDVKNLDLAGSGIKRIDWAAREMPVLSLLRSRFKDENTFRGIKISACLHVTTETANLLLVLRDGGADVRLCASNPLSTQDDVAAALVAEYGIPTFAIKGEDNDTYYKHINDVLDNKPHVTMDDGADLVSTLHKSRTELLTNIIGGTEETTTGVIRLRAMAADEKLLYPIVAVNEADTKRFFDNRYGTGQSTLDGITRATNILWAGRKVVVIGYGWCGRGIAMRAKGMGAHVTVCEVNPIRALEAVMDGFEVSTSIVASKHGEVFITATGGLKAISDSHYEHMRSGAIIANSGHFDVEIDIPALKLRSRSYTIARDYVGEYSLDDGRSIYVLAEGRLINLAAAEGHPSAVMDMSFANQALSVEYLVNKQGELSKDVYRVPQEIDESIGKLKLDAMGICIDTLSDEQRRYLETWEEGT